MSVIAQFNDYYPVFKEYYDRVDIQNLFVSKSRLFQLVAKDTKVQGYDIVTPLQYGQTVGSSSFAVAKQVQKPDDVAAFKSTLRRDYALATIDAMTKEAGKTNAGAFEDVARMRIDGAMDTASMRSAFALYRDGTGVVGRIKTISTGVISLYDPGEAQFIQIGMQLNASDTAGGDPRAAVGYVIGVDPSAGTLTVSASDGGAAGSPASWAADDYITPRGDINARPMGVLGYLPITNRLGSETMPDLFGVKRNRDKTRLGGVYVNRKDALIEEALIDLVAETNRFGGRTDFVFAGTAAHRALVKTLQGRKEYTQTTVSSSDGVISFKAVTIDGPNGPVPVIPDPFCPRGVALALQMDTWELKSIGNVPKILLYEDGISMFRSADDDALEARVGSYSQLTCNAPGRNGVAEIPN